MGICILTETFETPSFLRGNIFVQFDKLYQQIDIAFGQILLLCYRFSSILFQLRLYYIPF